MHLIGFDSKTIHTTVAVILDDGTIHYYNQDEVGFRLALHAAHYGTAVFEGMHECNGQILFLIEQWKRLCFSAKTVGIMDEDDTSFTLDLFRSALIELFRRNYGAIQYDEAGRRLPMYFRPLIVEGSCLLGVGSHSKWACIIITRDKTPYLGPQAQTGVVIWSPGPKHLRRTDPTNGFPQAKAASNYTLGYLWKGRAAKYGAVEVIQWDARGKHLAETTGSNLFVFGRDDHVYTPPLGAILEGITRRRSIAILSALGYQVCDSMPIGKRRMTQAAGMALTGTWSGVVPVRQVKVGYPTVTEGVLYATCPHPAVHELMKHYAWLLQRDPRCILPLDPSWHTLAM